MRLVVVGGVAGGMSAAARARRLSESAEIIVLERGSYVSYANCGLPYYLGGEIEDAQKLLVQTPEKLQAALKLDVRVNHEVIGLDPLAKILTVDTPSGEIKLDYDQLILSPGAQPFIPPIPGINSARVSALRTVDDAKKLRAKVDSGVKTAVVLGAGFIGIEAAEALARQGVQTTIVELSSQILPPVEPELASLLSKELENNQLQLKTGVAAIEILDGAEAATVITSDGSELPAEIIITSVGVRPDTAVFEAAGLVCERGAIVVDELGKTSLPNVWAVGDATLSTDAVTGVRRPVALAGPANRAGRQLADQIFRAESARAIPPALGTAIVRVFDLTVAITGANRKALDEQKIDYHTIHLHSTDHASYFPGAEPIHLILHFAKSDGRLLGAQAVGAAGVDKRIDILATAIRANFKAADLIDLDLSYSPPYGSAKDPILMAGMMAENVLSGQLKLWYSEELARDNGASLLVDVRSAKEFQSGHLAKAVNIPHTEIRARLDEIGELAAGRQVKLICASGVRSYLAHRILTEAGLESASLSGGMTTLSVLVPNYQSVV